VAVIDGVTEGVIETLGVIDGDTIIGSVGVGVGVIWKQLASKEHATSLAIKSKLQLAMSTLKSK